MFETLGDAYVKVSDKEKAIAMYETSATLNPQPLGVKGKLKKN